jgi:hypothetical protein
MSTELIMHGADQTSRLHWAGAVLTVVHQRVRPAPTQGWSTTDAAGHQHVYGSANDPYPTMTRVSDGWADPCENPECIDDIEYYHLVCAQCGETVWPAPGGPETQLLPGVFSYWIDSEQVTHRDALTFMGHLREGDPDRWERLRYWLKYSANLMPNTPRISRD